MTALKERRPAVSGRSASNLGTGLPQVNLLPPEISAARGLKRLKVWLLVALCLVLVGVAGAFVMAQSVATNAQSRVDDARDETTRLQAEVQTYAEVPRVLGQIADVEDARDVGLSTEIRWKTYVDAVTAVLPPRVSIDGFTVTGPAPAEELPRPSDALQGPSVGSISFEAQSVTVPDTAELIDALEGVPGFADARVTTLSRTEADGGVYYQISGSIQLTDGVFERRFVDVEEQ